MGKEVFNPNERAEGFTDYLNVYDGKFAKRFKEPTDETFTRVTEGGNTVHERYYKNVNGFITNVEKVDGKYGFNLVLRIEEADEKNEVTMKFYDRAVRTVLNKLGNVDFSEPITLMVGKNDEGKTWFTIKQEGKGYERDIVPNKFTAEELPKPQEIRVGGKLTWVYDGISDFIWDKLKETLASKPASQPAAPEPSDEDEAGSDGLPF